MENTKVKKILTKTANIIAVIIAVFVLIVAVSSTKIFGVTLYAVKSDSMKGDNPDSFNKGDLIFVKLINAEQQQDLKVGDIITFYDMINGKRELNTHRIVSIETVGTTTQITTKGDNASGEDTPIDMGSSDIVGVYSFKIGGLGNVILFIQSPTGFLVSVVIPSILVVIYCAYLLFKNLNVYNKEKKQIDMENMRKEILEDIQKNSK
jgi:signal peptidase